MHAVIELRNVTKRFSQDIPPAIPDVTADIRGGCVTGLVGPDGAGKTTLLRLMAGLLAPSEGEISILGENPSNPASNVRGILSYMPQKFGLYEDLTVMENLNLYADLRGVFGHDRRTAIERLLSFTGLAPFTGRLAGKLSGGMKQKLGLACALIQRPKVLLLDEPSVGVDPLSRRELWRMVFELAKEKIAVVWSTAYLDEAERCTEVLVLNEGRLLFKGPPKKLTEKIKGHTFLVTVPEKRRRRFAVETLQDQQVLDSVIQGRKVRLVMGTPSRDHTRFGKDIELEPVPPRFEDAVMYLMGGIPKERVQNAREVFAGTSQVEAARDDVVAEARELTKRFGSFTAVDRVSFKVRRGQVFGLLGPNGAGKSTTFKMLCGLLKPTAGEAKVAGVDLLKAPAKARERMGYMAQKFSLYGDLSVRQNLEFFGGVYGLKGKRLWNTVDRMIDTFQLGPFVHSNSAALPLGFKQRLSMACSIMHQPVILFLDEPTSGVDPITRREFWIRINSMVQAGMAVVVTTHFLDEAEYCDRIALIYKGRIIAMDTPDVIKQIARKEDLPEPTLEDAFIELIEQNMASSRGIAQAAGG
ncbi:MAG: ABC transporter ATP-binding protein [Deltaproteobacteria bacterium]|nr:ABC transporter ATP-binding protein [Deltaproteobacteria bacterium]